MKKSKDEATIIKRMRRAHKWSIFLLFGACVFAAAFFVRWMWLHEIGPVGCAFGASSSFCITIAAHLDDYIEKNRDPFYNGIFGWMRNAGMIASVLLALALIGSF